MTVGWVTMLASEDRILLRQLGLGSKDALRRIYEKYRRELFTIAAIQGTPLRTVHSRYRYAIEKLRELLREGTRP